MMKNLKACGRWNEGIGIETDRNVKYQYCMTITLPKIDGDAGAEASACRFRDKVHAANVPDASQVGTWSQQEQ
jgi:hypothetical protein